MITVICNLIEQILKRMIRYGLQCHESEDGYYEWIYSRPLSQYR